MTGNQSPRKSKARQSLNRTKAYILGLTKQHGWKAAQALAAGAIIYGLLVMIPGVWAGGDPQLEVEERRNLIAVLAGTLTVFIFLLNRQRHELEKDESRTNRYTEAVQLLGDERLTARLGGIYALQRLGNESPKDVPAIAQLLASFIREVSREIVEQHQQSENRKQPILDGLNRAPSDIVAATRVLGSPEFRPYYRSNLFLGEVSLQGAVLVGANLRNRQFDGFDLTESYLDGADLSSCSMVNVQLSGAHGRYVNFQGTRLHTAGMANCVMDGSDFLGADVSEMYVQGTSFEGAKIEPSFKTLVIGDWVGKPDLVEIEWL